MTNYIIIDDEPIAHDIIKGYCDLLTTYHLKKNCYDAIEAIAYLKNNTVDLIFLDLNMPKLSGFEFLKTLTNPPKVIVTTAYSEFAIQGYELNIVDYLLKPFSFERFVKAVNKIEVTNTKTNNSTSLSTNQNDSFFIKSNKKHIQLKYKDILFIEAVGNYCKIVTKNDEIQVREKISAIIKQLPENNFYQTHKSFIVAKEHIATIEGNLIMIKDYKIPIGKVYKNNLTKLFTT